MKHRVAWPSVMSEYETLALCLQGMSIGRYGDGEFKLCLGGGIKSQRFDAGLQMRLRAILRKSTPNCLVGIPNLNAPTKDFWKNYRVRQITDLLSMGTVYASAFISRPDSAPWIHRPDYWAQVESLWKGQRVTLVRGSGKSLTPKELASAASVHEIVCARQHAWADYPQLLEEALRAGRRTLLCCGPTATVLAADLAARGVHAIDLGHIGMWVKRQQQSAEQALAAGRADAS